MTIISPTGSLGFGYTPQRRIDWTSRGVRWIMIYDPAASRQRLFYSTNLGDTWTEGQALPFASADDGSLQISEDDRLHIVAKGDDGNVYYVLGLLSAAHTSVTWHNTGVNLGPRYLAGVVVGWQYGSGSRAAVLGHDTDGFLQFSRITSFVGGSWGKYSSSLGDTGSLTPRPALALHHTGDGKTPAGTLALWASYASGLSTWSRKAIGTSWSIARSIHTSPTTIRSSVFDGERFITAFPGGTGIKIVERNASDTDKAEHDITFPDGTIIDIDVGFDVNGDLHVGAVGDSSDPMIIRYDRSLAAWQSWNTLAAATGGALTIARRAAGHQLDVVYRDGTNAIHIVGATLNHAPTVPSGPVVDSVADVNEELVISWGHKDADGDPQAGVKLRRVIGATTTYWTGAAWTATETWVSSSVQSATLPAGWAAGGETAAFTVWTRDASLEESPATAAAFVLGSTKVNPVITTPLEGAVIETASAEVTWTVDEQTDYMLRLLDGTGAQLRSTGFRRNPTLRAATYDSLGNRNDYQIELTTKNLDGLASDPVVVNISVLYTPPPIPRNTISVDMTDNINVLRVHCENPAHRSPQPAVVGNNLWRSLDGGPLERVEVGLPPDFDYRYYASPHETEVTFVTEAYAAQGQISWSNTTTVNLLTRHQSNAEDDALGTSQMVAGANTTLSRTSVNPIEGSKSWLMTAVGVGPISMKTVAVPVEYGPSFTVYMTTRDHGRLTEDRVRVLQYDDDGNLLGLAQESDWKERKALAPPAPTPIETLSLRYSKSPDRSNPNAADGAAWEGTVYPFLWGSVNGLYPEGVTQVVMAIDGQDYRTDTNAPYDLEGGSGTSAAGFDTTTLSNDQHTITFTVTRDGVVEDPIVAIVSVLNQVAVGRLGLFSTSAALEVEKTRLESGTYPGAPYPNDAGTINADATTVAGDPDLARWGGPTSNNSGGAVLPDSNMGANGDDDTPYRPPIDAASKFRNACRWVSRRYDHADALSRAQLFAAELVAQAQVSGVNFADRNRWKLNTVLADEGPMWNIASWLTKLIDAYDELHVYELVSGNTVFTDNQRNLLNSWFAAGAVWCEDGVAQKMSGGISNWKSASIEAEWNVTSTNLIGKFAYNGAPEMRQIQRRLNNRFFRTARYVAVEAEHSNNANRRDTAKRTVVAQLRYGYSGAGWTGDFERWTNTEPWKGLKYALETFGAAAQIADVQARNGDDYLYELSTTIGDDRTGGVHIVSGLDKSLWTMAWDLAAYINGQYTRNTLNGDRITVDTRRIDDLNLMPSNQYALKRSKYRAGWVRDTYLRTAAGTPAWPANPQYGQDTPPDHGTYPALGFVAHHDMDVEEWG